MDENTTVADKKSDASSNRAVHQITNVYIWDMDETLILLKSLLHGTYAKAFNGSKDPEKGVEIGRMWENHILQICDSLFFYEQIENYNQPFLDALSQYDDGQDLSEYDFKQDGFTTPFDDLNKRKLAYRHKAIANKYEQGLHNLLDKETIRLWDDLYDLADSYTDRWFSSARAFLGQHVGEDDAQVITWMVSVDCLWTVCMRK